MRTRASTGTLRALLPALAVALLLLGGGAPPASAGVSDSELTGYKGGLVQIALRDGTNVRGVLYGWTETHLELELAQDRAIRLHRTWVASLKAAPAGAQKSAVGEFPRGAAEAYRAEAAPPRETPPERPALGSGTGSAPETPTGTATPSAAAAPEPPSGTILDKGIVFGLRLGGNLLTVVGGGIASWLNGSFFFGYKFGKLTLGLGLEMSYSDDSLPNADPEPIETSASMVLFQPTLEYYLATKGAMVFYTTVGLHLGFMNLHVDPGKDATDPMVGFHLGLGLRYFFAPRFAVGIEGGLRGVWLMVENDDSTDVDDNTTGVLSIYGAATLTAIW